MSVLPHWVNDYQMLNMNTVLDAHPLPHVDDILANCAKGKIWSKLDMTNSFFQTLVHLDDIHLTEVTTPFGLYEWMAIPMGLKNAPPIHQCHMTAALLELIGDICHVYIDDLVIWSVSYPGNLAKSNSEDLQSSPVSSLELRSNKSLCQESDIPLIH